MWSHVLSSKCGYSPVKVVTFTEEILNGKFHVLRSVSLNVILFDKIKTTFFFREKLKFVNPKIIYICD